MLGVLAAPVQAEDEGDAADPFLTTDALLLAYARDRLAEGTEGGALLTAARAFATAPEQARYAERLLALVDAWAALAHDDLARACRLAEAWARMRLAGERAAWPEVLDVLASVEADLAGGLDTMGLAGVHREAARAHAHLAQPGRAVVHGRVAAEIAGRIGWHEKAASLWHQTARFASSNGEYEAARAAALAALAAHRRSGSEALRPVLRHDLAIATYRAGQLRQAVPLAEAARREALGAGDAHTAARVLNTLVNIHLALGDVDRSLEIGERAIAEAKALDDRDGWLTTRVNVAGAYARKGRFSDAIAACEEVLASPEAERDVQLHASAAGNLAGTYVRLGKVDEAVRLLERSVERARAAGLEALAVDLEGGLAAALIDTEKVARTPDVLERILAYYARTGNRQAGARVRASLAAAYTRLGRDAEAETMQTEALAGFLALGDRLGAARARTGLATAHESRRRWNEAWSGHRSALREYRALGLRVDDTALSLVGCARIQIKAGSPEKALPFLDEAIAIYLDLLHGLGDEDALGLAARVRPIADWGVAVAHNVRHRDPQREREAAAIAYRYLESARAILLGEALANAAALLDAALPVELGRARRDSREEVESARRRLVALATSGAEAEPLLEAKRALDAAWRERRACVARVQRTARREASLAYPEVVPFEDLQRSLDADTVLVLYRFLRFGFALVVTHDDAALVRLSESEPIRQAVRAYLRVLSTPDLGDEELAAELYDRLIGPIEDRIAGAKHLVVSPDGVLAYLPFGALLDPGEEPAERLLTRCTVTMVPSASVLVALRSETPPTRGSRVLAIGDPVYGAGAPSLPRLPQSGVEAQEVAAFFPAAARTILRREEATVERVVRALASDGPRFGSVHLACHALIDARCPRRSGLALSDGAMLDVDRILGLHIPADLAVLSACDTARGQLAGGEGVMGFVRAFFHAGVPRVVVSSWPVSDASTLPLMRALYEGIVREELPPAEALRRAQRACLEGGGARAHPHHWAAFTLWGQDR